MAEIEKFDLVVVGAGIHGLVIAKTYRDVHPEASILVLDKSQSIGGVWAKDRLYPGLHTNNHFRTFEFSDLPMDTEGFDLVDGHIPGEHVNKYLHSYVETFNLAKHIRLETSVKSAVDQGPMGWMLTVSRYTNSTETDYQIEALRLVVATGLTSEPLMPKLDGKETFGAPIYHSSEFAKAEGGLGPYKKIALLSGAKFSWDIAYAYASAGVQVDWIIRESGHGPCWMMPNRLTPLRIIPELLIQTRLITWLSPSMWDDGFTYIRNFFHQHWFGKKISDALFTKMQHATEEINGYDSHPETAKLKPWDNVFFIGTNRGLLNYKSDFFELVRNGMIRVHIADISHLSPHAIHLSTGTAIQADVLICGTGWKDTPQLDFQTTKDLGLPGYAAKAPQDHIRAADAQIFATFPKLQNQPAPRDGSAEKTQKETQQEPYRLYRYIVPPAFIPTRTLAFAGAYRSPATTIISQTQALWITAYFDDRIPTLQNTIASKRIMYETVLHTQFSRWRYSRGFGARFPDMFFDCLPYVDRLLRDVGVRNERKGSWWRERFTAYMPGDYRGVVGEYLALGRR
ncbi:hypothetical protein COCSADRAFT_135788 [Bipolaris sorokiniana ND90Pr]|uniref:FAD/NAD(P)-binding domain-containing protein n=1 Tax=Cochliobolus sativus (strain ND90Pr / ATCC 201652) TaxID=665912 RepID=M2SIX2_COCSN|nr:uncharacterized protein COCSADRAFT_135788 [Bipolaris sorokiniana ND90Pr]EMD67133.1 hypothetical protein COCSADRAFT_135788 [Bipolaris sorokiniana ND90Pr]